MGIECILLLILSINVCIFLTTEAAWSYECKQNYCVKLETTTEKSLSLSECNLLCLDGSGLWPKPTGKILVANLTEINIDNISLHTQSGTLVTELVNKGFAVFKSQMKEGFKGYPVSVVNGTGVIIRANIKNQNLTRLKLNTDESYTLQVTLTESLLDVGIKANSYFGFRNGLETLSQLIVHDNLRNMIVLPSNVSIEDKPVYRWRGVMLDTARNFVSVDIIKNTLRAMAASKLNTFHWHLTDSQSFPYVSKSRPALSLYGAYSPQKVYNDKDIKIILEYARVRGIRIVPEFDAPAHVGEGWQKTGVITCFNSQPWQSFCSEPPCGQLDPSQPKAYDILEDIYGDMLDHFGTDVFHMGGDEVNVKCWNNTDNLKNWMINKGWNLTTTDFLNVWAYFQNEAVQRLYKKAGKEIPVILWNSDLTSLENVTSVLPNDKYYIQVWDASYRNTLETLLAKNYTIILSNYDMLYLDCGNGKFTYDGVNWCSPYKTWQQIYENKPINIVGSKKNQILGGETALWTETSGSGSIDSRIWPRAAAFAESLWSEPTLFWTEAEERMHIHRERLTRLGVNADALVPEWCLQNQQQCTEYTM